MKIAFRKRAPAVILILMLAGIISGCGRIGDGDAIKRPETNLEFWICDNADEIDFSNCTELGGIMGGWRYYGSAYTPEKGKDGRESAPEEYVIYTVTHYPDYSSEGKCITRIEITDPAVSVYGITVRSSEAEVKVAMSDYGYRLTEITGLGCLMFEKGKISISFFNGRITISAYVSNKMNIIY